MNEFSEDFTVSARSEVVSCALGQGSALLDMRTNIYYNMNAVATVIWSGIQTPTQLKDIYAAVEARFETSGRDYRADVQELLRDLIKLDLVTACEESDSPG